MVSIKFNRRCKCCGRECTEKNTENIGENKLKLDDFYDVWVNCPCGTTLLIRVPHRGVRVMQEVF